MGSKKAFFGCGQVAIEYLALFAFLLMVVGVLFAVSFMTVNDSVSFHKIRDSLLRISSAAENISALGEGSMTTVYIELPKDVQSFEAEGNYLRISALYGGGTSDFSESSNASFSYSVLPTGAGSHRLLLEVSDGNITISQV